MYVYIFFSAILHYMLLPRVGGGGVPYSNDFALLAVVLVRLSRVVTSSTEYEYTSSTEYEYTSSTEYGKRIHLEYGIRNMNTPPVRNTEYEYTSSTEYRI